MSSVPSSPKRGCSPAYSSCSSEDPERKCLRCIEQKYNNGTSSNEFPTRGKFTRSFSVDSTQSFEELFKKSEEDFSAEGTKVLFCKPLNVTSDEDDEKKGMKRSFEDRRERKRNGRYKRHCASEDYGDKLPSLRPPSRCSISSQMSPRTPTRRTPRIEDDISEDLRPSSRSSVRSDQSRLTAKRLPKRPVWGKEKSKPASNRNLFVTNLQKDLKSQQSQDSEKSELKKGTDGNKKQIIKVPGKNNKFRLEDNEEVTIYEKTIITVTSSDNYLMGDPLSPAYRYKSEISPMQCQKLTNVITSQLKPDLHRPASIEVYGTPNKKTFRKGLLNRDASVTQSNDIQILPVIQELNIGVDNAKSSPLRGKTKSMSSAECKFRDLVKSPQKSKALTPNMNMLASKIHVRGFQSISHGSTLFPNSCMKKETIKTKSSRKSVRFMVSESQCNLGGETITKKSFRLEKFPSNKTKSSNVTAAPVVMRIENPTLELMKGALGGEVMENIICRETAQRVIQEQLINKLGIIHDMSYNGGHNVHNMLRGPSVVSIPGEPLKFAIEGKTKDNSVEKFRATAFNRPGTKDVTEVEYTLSDLGIPHQKNTDKIGTDVQQNPNPEGKCSVVIKVDAKRNSLEQRRNEIRLKLNQPNPKNDGISRNKEGNKNDSVVTSGGNRTIGSPEKPGRSGDAKTPAKERVDVKKKLGDTLPPPRRGRNPITALSKATNSKNVRKETIATLKSDQLLKNGNIQIEIRGGSVSTTSKSTKTHSRPATSGTKSVDSRDRSPISGVSTMSGVVRPRSAELRTSSSGGLKSRGVSESNGETTADPRLVTNGGYIIMETSVTSSNRPPSRKPHMSSPNRSNKGSESPDRSPGSPRTPLTLRPCGKPDLKTTSTIREHLRSSALHPAAPEEVHEELERTDVKSAKRRSKKLSGHPLRFKTLSQFMIERQLSMGCTKKKNVNDTRRISEPINHKR